MLWFVMQCLENVGPKIGIKYQSSVFTMENVSPKFLQWWNKSVLSFNNGGTSQSLVLTIMWNKSVLSFKVCRKCQFSVLTMVEHVSPKF